MPAKTVDDDGRIIDASPVDPLVPVISPAASESLDELMRLTIGDDDPPKADDKPVDDEPPKADDKPVDDEPPKADDEPPKADDKPVDDEPPKADDKPVDDKPVDDKPVDDKPVDDKPVDDKASADDFEKRLNDVQLPPHSRAKSSEAFATVKEIARTEIKTEREARKALEQKLAEEIERGKTKVATDEVETLRRELDDLRKFRAVHLADQDPKVIQFDGQIKANEEAIYSKFLEYGGKQTQVDEIKKHGGPRKIEWEPLLKHMTLPQRRFIESKLVESEGIAFNREQILNAAKADPEKWEKDYNQRRFSRADEELGKAEWLKPVALAKDATDEQRKAAAFQNDRRQKLQTLVKSVLTDTSPEMHAQLAVGTALAHDLRWQLDNLAAYRERELKELKDTHSKALDAVTKERDSLKADLERIRKSSGNPRKPGLGDGRAGHKPASAPGQFDLSRPTAESLDALRDQVLAGQS